MTVRPPFVARDFRYATAAIALALCLWAVCGYPARRVRAEVSPWQGDGRLEPNQISPETARLSESSGEGAFDMIVENGKW